MYFINFTFIITKIKISGTVYKRASRISNGISFFPGAEVASKSNSILKISANFNSFEDLTKSLTKRNRFNSKSASNLKTFGAAVEVICFSLLPPPLARSLSSFRLQIFMTIESPTICQCFPGFELLENNKSCWSVWRNSRRQWGGQLLILLLPQIADVITRYRRHPCISIISWNTWKCFEISVLKKVLLWPFSYFKYLFVSYRLSDFNFPVVSNGWSFVKACNF